MSTEDDMDFEFDNDDDLNFESDSFDLEAEGTEVKDDRNPVVKTKDATLETVKDELKNTDRYVETIKENLPTGYKAAWRSADAVIGETRTMYQSAAQELRPTLLDLKRTTKRLLPSLKGVMPEKIGKKIEELVSEDDTEAKAEAAAQDSDTAAIAGSLGQIFQAQAEHQDQEKQETIARETMRDTIQDAQARKGISLSVDTTNQLARLNAYNDNIDSKVSKQSLELQFRSYFALRDMLAISKRSSVDTVDRLGEIVKNTALPDIVKFKQSEAFMQQFRDNLYGSRIDSIRDAAAPFMKRLVDGVKGKVQEKVQGVKESFETGIDMANNIAEGQEAAAEAGMSLGAEDIAGSVIGGNLVDRLFRKIGTKFGEAVNSNETIRTGSNMLQQITDDPEGTFRLLADADENTEIFGVKVKDNALLSSMAKAASKLDPGTVSEMERVSVQSNPRESMLDPAYFDNMTRKSIVETIPEYLSRILAEAMKFNGGDGERMVYNPTKGHITSMSVATKDALRESSNIENNREYGEKVNDVITEIDTEGSLNNEDRLALSQFLREKSTRHELFDAGNIVRDLEQGSFDTAQRDRLVQLMKETFGISDDGSISKAANKTRKQMAVSRRFSKLRKHQETGNDLAIDHAAMGTSSILREANILKDGDRGYVWNDERIKDDLDNSIYHAVTKDRTLSDGEEADKKAKSFMGIEPALSKVGPMERRSIINTNTDPVLASLHAERMNNPYAVNMGHDFTPEDAMVQAALQRQREEIRTHKASIQAEMRSKAPRPTVTTKPDDTPVTPQTTPQKPLGRRAPGKQGGFLDLSSPEPIKPITPEVSKPSNVEKETKAFGDGLLKALGSLEETLNTTVTEKVNNLFLNAEKEKEKAETESVEDDDSIEDNPQLADSLYSVSETMEAMVGTNNEVIDATLSSGNVTHDLLEKLIATNTQGFNNLLERSVALESVQQGKLARARGFVSKTLGKGMGMIGTGIKGTAKFGAKTALKGAQLGIKGAIGTVKLGARIVTKPYRMAYTGDLYLKGDSSGVPILTKARLARGDYYKVNKDGSTGKQIKSFKASNIRYGVKDKDGNYVLTPEHLEQGLTRVNGKALVVKGLKAGGWLLDKLTLGMFTKTTKRIRSLGKTIGSIANKAGNLTKSIGNYGINSKDIFVSGETEPRLTVADLKAGKYRSKKTGMVLTSFAHIDGPVMDQHNKQQLLSVDDLDNLHDVDGNPIKIAGLMRSLVNISIAPVTIAFKPFKWLGKKIKSTVEDEFRTDIHKKGEKDATLIYNELLKGAYYDKESGEPLKSFADIRGPVIDKQRNVLLTEEDIKNGLYRPDGTEFKAIGALGKLRRGVGVALKSPLTAIKWAKDKVKGGLTNLLDMLGMGKGSALSGFLGSIGQSFKRKLVQMKVTTDVVNIYTKGGKQTIGEDIKGKLKSFKNDERFVPNIIERIKARFSFKKEESPKPLNVTGLKAAPADQPKGFAGVKGHSFSSVTQVNPQKSKVDELVAMAKAKKEELLGSKGKPPKLSIKDRLRNVKDSILPTSYKADFIGPLPEGMERKQKGFVQSEIDKRLQAFKDRNENKRKERDAFVGPTMPTAEKLKRAPMQMLKDNPVAKLLPKSEKKDFVGPQTPKKVVLKNRTEELLEKLVAKVTPEKTEKKGTFTRDLKAAMLRKKRSIPTKESIKTSLVRTKDKMVDDFRKGRAISKAKAKREEANSERRKRKIVAGDADGDGDRDGGYKDILANKRKGIMDKLKARREERLSDGIKGMLKELKLQNKLQKKGNAYAKETADGQGGLWNTLREWGPMALSAITGLGTMFMGAMGKLATAIGLGKGADAIGDGVGDLAEGALDSDGKKTKSKGKKGIFSKLLGGIKKYGSKALSIGTTVGIGALKAVGSGIATAAAGVSAATVGVVAAGVAAVGAVGYGAFQGYKAMQRRKPITPIESVRFAMYGSNGVSQDELIALRYLEDELEGDVSGTKSDVDVLAAVDSYASDFGIDEQDHEGRQLFATWLAKRFLPVFQTWQGITEVHDTDTRGAGDLSLQEQVKIAKGTLFGSKDSEDPYVVAGPFNPTVGKDAIKAAIDNLQMAKLPGTPVPPKQPKAPLPPIAKTLVDKTSMTVAPVATKTLVKSPALKGVAPTPALKNPVQKAIAKDRVNTIAHQLASGEKVSLPKTLKAGLSKSAEKTLNVAVENKESDWLGLDALSGIPDKVYKAAKTYASTTTLGRAVNVLTKDSSAETAKETAIAARSEKAQQELVRKRDDAQMAAMAKQTSDETKANRNVVNSMLSGQLKAQGSMVGYLSSLVTEMQMMREELKNATPTEVVVTTENSEVKAEVKENKIQRPKALPTSPRQVTFPLNTGKSNLQRDG